MIKQVIFSAAILIISINLVHAQTVDTIPMYKKIHTIPYFALIQTDSTIFKSTNIPKQEKVLIIYFSPECGHCQVTAQHIVDNMDKIKSAFEVWVSYYSVPRIKEFVQKYKLDQFSNIKIGRDTAYSVPSFYKVKFTPFMALYDKNGKLLQAFEGGTDIDTLSKWINE